MSLSEEARRSLEAISAGQHARELESDTLDFKTVGRSVDDTLTDLAEAAACFANGRGGQVVVGVRDKGGGPDAFVGVDLDVVRVQRRIFERTVPSLVVDVSEEWWNGARLVLIAVPRSPTIHQVKGRATERVGTSCEPMTSQRIARVIADREGHDWSSDDSGVPVERVSPRAIEEAQRLLADSIDAERRQWAEISVPDLLRRLGVVTLSGTLTNGGALLFVSQSDRNLLQYTHRRARSGELTTNQWLSAPGITCFLRCVEMIENRMDRTPINLPSGQQLLIPDLPEAAYREAIANAFMHRDYNMNGVVQVEHSPTHIAVTSPGGFVSGVTPENILTVSSRPRNPALALAIRHLGLAEMAGVGVDRMYAEMTRVGHEPPVFDSDDYRVSVTLIGGAPNAALTRFVTTLPDQHRSNPDTLLVLFVLLTKRTVTAEQLAPMLQKGVSEVELVLQGLAAPPVELVERTRESARMRRGVYRLRSFALAQLGSGVSYNRRTDDEIDRKVVDVVRELGAINSKVVRSILDVDGPAASRILGDLVERHVLAKTSPAQRGPAVSYGPGSKFPRAVRARGRAEDEGQGG